MSSDSASAKPAKPLNGSAKEWIPKSAPILPVNSGYEYGHNDSNFSGGNSNSNNYNNSNRKNEYGNNGQHHPQRNSMPNNRYNNGNHNAASAANTAGGQHMNNAMYGPSGLSGYVNPAIIPQQFMQYPPYGMPYNTMQMMPTPMYYSPDMYYQMGAMLPGNLVGFQGAAATGYPVATLPIAQGLQPPAMTAVLLPDAAGLSVAAEPMLMATPVDEADAVADLNPVSLPAEPVAASVPEAESSQLTEAFASESAPEEGPSVTPTEAAEPLKDPSNADPPLTVETSPDTSSLEPLLLPEEGQPLVYSKEALLSLFPADMTMPPSLRQVYADTPCRPPLVSTGQQGFRNSPKGSGEGPPSRGSGNYNSRDSRDGRGDYRGGGYRGGNNSHNNHSHHNSSPRDNGGRALDDLSEAVAPAVVLGGEGSFSNKVMRNLELSQQDREPARDSPDVVIKKATLILNKLTPTKFEKLSDEFLELVMQQPLDSMDLLNRVVELLVTKAQLEEHFCFMYADLCKKITDCWTVPKPAMISEDSNSKEEAAGEEADGDAAATPAVETMGAHFRLLLLLRCQKEFETDMHQRLEAVRALPDLAADELAEKELLIKKRYIGHMRFIGEIYIKDIVQGTVINEKCLQVLIQETDEEQLVCLCKLLQTVGDKLEKYFAKKARTKKGKEKKLNEIMPGHFARIQQLAQEHPSSRIRYMLKDLSEMRSNNWTARVETEKVVDLSESRKPAHSSSASNAATSNRVAVSSIGPADPPAASVAAPATAPTPAPAADAWTVVGVQTKTKKSSSALAVPASAGAKAAKGPVQPAAGGKKPANPGNPPPAKKSSNTSNSNPGNKQRRDDKDVYRPPSSSSSTAKTQEPLPAVVTPSPVEEEEVPQEAYMDRDLANKVRASLDELFATDILEEACLVLRELVPPNCTAEMVRVAVSHSLEGSDKSRTLLVELLSALFLPGSSAGTASKDWVLDSEVLAEGFRRLLEELEDLIMDAPFAIAFVAKMVAGLVHSKLLSLTFVRNALADQDGRFSQSPKAAEFLLEVLQKVASLDGDGLQWCESALQQAGIELRHVLQATRDAELKLPALLTKYSKLQPLLV